jgi:hypothetical protein
MTRTAEPRRSTRARGVGRRVEKSNSAADAAGVEQLTLCIAGVKQPSARRGETTRAVALRKRAPAGRKSKAVVKHAPVARPWIWAGATTRSTPCAPVDEIGVPMHDVGVGDWQLTFPLSRRAVLCSRRAIRPTSRRVVEVAQTGRRQHGGRWPVEREFRHWWGARARRPSGRISAPSSRGAESRPVAIAVVRSALALEQRSRDGAGRQTLRPVHATNGSDLTPSLAMSSAVAGRATS